MDSKIWWGITGLSVGVWLLPGMADAEELAPIAQPDIAAPEDVALNQVVPDQAPLDAATPDQENSREAFAEPVAESADPMTVSPAIAPEPATTLPATVSPPTPVSTQAAALQENGPLEVGMSRPVPPVSESVQPKLSLQSPAARPTEADRSSQSSLQPPNQAAPVDSSTASPRLYGQPSPASEVQPATDPLEQWTDAEWLQLLEADSESQITQEPAHSEPTPIIQSQSSQPTSSLQTQSPGPIAPLPHSPAPLLSQEPTVNLEDTIGQVTSVSQLSDVQPTDWAYQALQSLVERYGVIQGYPDSTFRGDRPLTRFEFAAGVNAAMERMTELIANSSKDAVSKTDLETLRRLQEDFSNELIGLRGRVDGLEARVAELSAQQFSTTVVLNGQVTFGVADAWGGAPPGLGETNTVFAYLAQLQLAGSFSENDAFRIDLDAGNFKNGGFAAPEALNTQMALMGFQTDTDNTLQLSGAEYRVAVGDRLVLTFKPVGFALDTVLSPNSLFSSVSQGALSRFAAENPIFKIGSLDSGLGLDWLMTDRLRLQVAYGARNAGDPLQGLFKSDHRALGVQLLARPFSTVTTGLAYVNAFAEDGFLDTFTGSTNADTSGGFLEPAAINAVSGTLQWQIVPSVVFGAWGGLTVTDSLSSDAVALSTTYLFSLAFPDTFGREGDLLGVMVGQPLRLRYGLFIEREDEASGLQYELFYRVRVNDNIAITPAVFVVTDPGHVADNNTIVVAALRTSFSF